MSVGTKVAIRGAFLSLPAAMIVTYWASRLIPPSIGAWILTYSFFVLVLAPVAAGSAVAIWWGSVRWGRSYGMSMTVGIAVGVFTFYLEAIVLYFVYPVAFGNPFSAANLFPGLLTGALAGYTRIGMNSTKVI
jgi:hypothetical protein